MRLPCKDQRGPTYLVGQPVARLLLVGVEEVGQVVFVVVLSGFGPHERADDPGGSLAERQERRRVRNNGSSSGRGTADNVTGANGSQPLKPLLLFTPAPFFFLPTRVSFPRSSHTLAVRVLSPVAVFRRMLHASGEGRDVRSPLTLSFMASISDALMASIVS